MESVVDNSRKWLFLSPLPGVEEEGIKQEMKDAEAGGIYGDK